jgi:hypothetical protein
MCVDIDQVPLRDYKKGMDEGNGEEVEEIEEGVFDGSQPTQRKRTMNYTDVEYACLVRAWRSVLLDVVADNDQTGKMYWYRD